MLGLAIEFDLMSRTKTTVPSIEDYYSKLNLVAFLRNDSVKGTIDRANETLRLDDRTVMIITGMHDTFMGKKKLGPNQRGDKYKLQVAAASTYVTIEMEFMRTHDSAVIRTVDEIERAYGPCKSAMFGICDEIVKALKLNRLPIAGIEYAKRGVDVALASLVESGVLEMDTKYTSKAKDLLVKMMENGVDFSSSSKGASACAVANVLQSSGLRIEPAVLARAAGMSAGSFFLAYNSFKDKLKQM